MCLVDPVFSWLSRLVRFQSRVIVCNSSPCAASVYSSASRGARYDHLVSRPATSHKFCKFPEDISGGLLCARVICCDCGRPLRPSAFDTWPADGTATARAGPGPVSGSDHIHLRSMQTMKTCFWDPQCSSSDLSWSVFLFQLRLGFHVYVSCYVEGSKANVLFCLYLVCELVVSSVIPSIMLRLWLFLGY